MTTDYSPAPSGRALSAYSPLPLVTALCPTYGRFSLLREALACFLAQDYPNKQLIILNDAPEPILLTTHYSLLTLVNRPAPFANLGEKRQWLLERAASPLCAHWDDDDLYLPWHLSMCVEFLLERPEFKCVKPHGAWYMPDGEVHGIHHNMFEGQFVFDRERALGLGGYPPKHSGQAAELMRKFYKAGQFRQFEPWPGPSYVYRWGQGIGHISSLGDPEKAPDEGKNASALKEFQRSNTDFGDGEPLTPADLTFHWAAVLESARKELSNDDYDAFEARLNALVPNDRSSCSSCPSW